MPATAAAACSTESNPPVLAVGDDGEEGGEVQGEEPGPLLSCGLCLTLILGLLGCQLQS